MSQNFNNIAPPVLSPAEIRGLNRKLRVLIRDGGALYEAVFLPRRLSPSRQFIKVGGYHSDQLSGWLDIDQIHVVEILEEMPDEPQPTGRKSF